MATNSTQANSFLTAFIAQCKTLGRTMTIKSGISAEELNKYLELVNPGYSVNKLDPTTWKYYMNIAGEYHPLDKKMTVISLDTQETIEFTKESLAVHVATKEAYAFGTRYYYSLLNAFPEQLQLIMGILYPVDKAKAIEAAEGTILGYPDGLVESQEQTLIPELELFIKNYIHRWHVSAFAVTDSMYLMAFHMQLYANLLPKIINLRTKRCHTNEVHSFHIREYLASHNYLNKYLPYLTLKQALYLYRNINYLMRNAGSVANFNELLQKILTERRIPLSEYSMRQLNTFDSKYYPELTARRKPLNAQFNSGEVSYIPVDLFYQKENDLSYGNTDYYSHNADGVTKQFQNSNSAVIQTKTLESNMVDYNDAVPDPLPEVLMRQWAFMATHDLYNVSVNFKDPVSGELRTLYAQDALIYHQYILYKSLGLDIVELPQYYNRKSRRNPKPSLQDLVEVADSKFTDFPAIAQEILNGQPVLNECFSIKAFYDQSYKIYEQAQKHWFMTSNEADYERRGYLEGMILRLYQDELIEFNVGTTSVVEWLSAVNLPEYDYTYEQAQELMTNIFLASTGMTIDDTKSLPNIQKNLIELFMKLSSYTIRTIREINDSAIIPVNWPAIRIGNLQTHADSDQYVEINSRVNEVNIKGKDTIEVESGGIGIQSIAQSDGIGTIEVPAEVTVVMDVTIILDVPVPFKAMDISYSYPEYDPAQQTVDGYLGKEFFTALSDEQKMKLFNNPPL